MEELRKSYQAGIASLILIVAFFVLLASLVYVNNSIAVLVINIASFIIIALALALYFKMLYGYVDIGRKYSLALKRSTYGIMICIVVFLLLLVLLYFASIEGSMLIFNLFAFLLLVGYLAFAVLKIVSGVAIYKVPVKSNTKSTLSIFSVLYGIFMITLVGIVFLPYVKIMETIFEILFLKDTYQKGHKNKTKRNLWWWISGLVIYLILIGVVGYLFWSFILVWRNFF